METILNQIYFEKYKKKFDKLIYLTIFREIISLYISSQFEMYGNFYKNNRSNDISILNHLNKNLDSYLGYCEKWLKEFFKKSNIDIKKIRKNKFLLKETKKNAFYFCSINEIDKLYKIIGERFLLSQDSLVDYNVSNKKEYAKKYNSIKKQFFHQQKNSIHKIKRKFKFLKRLEQALKIN